MNFRIAEVLLISVALFAMLSAAPMLLVQTKANTTTRITVVAGDPVGGGVPSIILPFGDPVGGGVPQNQPNGSQTV